MARNISKYIIAGIAGAANITAAPYSSDSSLSSTSTWPSTSVASASATSIAITLPSITVPTPAAPINSASASAAASAAAAKASANAALAKEALSDVTNVARFNTLLTIDGAGKELLPADELRDRVVFDFGAQAATLGAGGRFALANEFNFPILVDQSIATAVAFLNPCSMNSPHIHPRATEFLTVVQGTVQTGFMLENGFLANADTHALTTEIATTLTAFQGTVFPQGSIHFQFNPTCAPAAFVATLNSADPGTSQVAQNLFFLDDAVVNITLGAPKTVDGGNLEAWRAALPANLVQAVESCLARCDDASPSY